jgi:hypothetical protein
MIEALWTGQKLWRRAVQGMIVPSRQLRKYLARQGIDKEKITVARFPAGIERIRIGNAHAVVPQYGWECISPSHAFQDGVLRAIISGGRRCRLACDV